MLTYLVPIEFIEKNTQRKDFELFFFLFPSDIANLALILFFNNDAPKKKKERKGNRMNLLSKIYVTNGVGNAFKCQSELKK